MKTIKLIFKIFAWAILCYALAGVILLFILLIHRSNEVENNKLDSLDPFLELPETNVISNIQQEK